MQSQSLTEFNDGNGKGEPLECPAKPDLEKLTGSVQALVERIDAMLEFHRWIIRILLIVVCVIALGRSAIDLGKDLFLNSTARAEIHNERR